MRTRTASGRAVWAFFGLHILQSLLVDATPASQNAHWKTIKHAAQNGPKVGDSQKSICSLSSPSPVHIRGAVRKSMACTMLPRCRFSVERMSRHCVAPVAMITASFWLQRLPRIWGPDAHETPRLGSAEFPRIYPAV